MPVQRHRRLQALLPTCPSASTYIAHTDLLLPHLLKRKTRLRCPVGVEHSIHVSLSKHAIPVVDRLFDTPQTLILFCVGNLTNLLLDRRFGHCWMSKRESMNRIRRTRLFGHRWSLNWSKSSTSKQHIHRSCSHHSVRRLHLPTHTTSLEGKKHSVLIKLCQHICLTKQILPRPRRPCEKKRNVLFMQISHWLVGRRTSLIPLTIAFIVACRGPSTVFPSSTGPERTKNKSAIHSNYRHPAHPTMLSRYRSDRARVPWNWLRSDLGTAARFPMSPQLLAHLSCRVDRACEFLWKSTLRLIWLLVSLSSSRLTGNHRVISDTHTTDIIVSRRCYFSCTACSMTRWHSSSLSLKMSPSSRDSTYWTNRRCIAGTDIDRCCWNRNLPPHSKDRSDRRWLYSMNLRSCASGRDAYNPLHRP